MIKRGIVISLLIALAEGALFCAPYVQDRHYIGQDTCFDLLLSADTERPETLFDIGIGATRIGLTTIYGPPSWFVRFRLGAVWATDPAFSLATGIEVPLWQMILDPTDQPGLSLRAFADALFAMDGSPGPGFDIGAALSVTPNSIGPSLGWRSSVRQGQWSHAFFLAYTGAFYAGKHTRKGESS